MVVGHEEDTYCSSLTAGEVTWGGLAPQTEPFDAYAQIRYHHDAVACTVTPNENGLHIDFHEAQRSVTPGQWAVVYDKEGRVLAASIIDAYETAQVGVSSTRAVAKN